MAPFMKYSTSHFTEKELNFDDLLVIQSHGQRALIILAIRILQSDAICTAKLLGR